MTEATINSTIDIMLFTTLVMLFFIIQFVSYLTIKAENKMNYKIWIPQIIIAVIIAIPSFNYLDKISKDIGKRQKIEAQKIEAQKTCDCLIYRKKN